MLFNYSTGFSVIVQLLIVSISKKNENILVFSNKKCYNRTTYARKRVDEDESKNNIIHKDNYNSSNARNVVLYRDNNL